MAEASTSRPSVRASLRSVCLAHARRRLSPWVAALLALALALAPALGAMARAHEALHEVAGEPAEGHFHAATVDDDDCGAWGDCAHADHADGGALHRVAHAVDCCAHVVATLPSALHAQGAPPGGSPSRTDVATPASLWSQALLEPPIR
jgi:hypothetical protein